MTKQAELIAYLFDGKTQAIAGQLQEWLDSSPRFTAFTETYRDKIRKKIRVLREAESARDLLGELEVAYRLLADRRFAVAYEPYASKKRRGPDFAITYRANLVFNLEVARIRGGAAALEAGYLTERLLRILFDKLGQMQPGRPNLLVVQVPVGSDKNLDLAHFMLELKIRVEKKDSVLYALTRYSDPAAYYKDFIHLSGMILWPATPDAEPAQAWLNKQARPALPSNVLQRVSTLAARSTLNQSQNQGGK